MEGQNDEERRETSDEMSESLNEVWELMVGYFGLSTIHKRKEALVSLNNARVKVKVENFHREYVTERRMMTEDQWDSLEKWYKEKLIRNERPLVPVEDVEQNPFTTGVSQGEGGKTGKPIGYGEIKTAVAKALKSAEEKYEALAETVGTLTETVRKISSVISETTTWSEDVIREIRDSTKGQDQRLDGMEEKLGKILTLMKEWDEGEPEEATRKQAGDQKKGEVKAANTARYNPRCNECGAYGHLRKDCPHPGEGCPELPL